MHMAKRSSNIKEYKWKVSFSSSLPLQKSPPLPVSCVTSKVGWVKSMFVSPFLKTQMIAYVHMSFRTCFPSTPFLEWHLLCPDLQHQCRISRGPPLIVERQRTKFHSFPLLIWLCGMHFQWSCILYSPLWKTFIYRLSLYQGNKTNSIQAICSEN